MKNQNTITIDRLRYFQEAANVQHIGLAAKNLNISPSVISAAIQVLESELGYELFKRSKQRIKLNLRGQTLLNQVNGILESIADLGSDLESSNGQIRGHYRLGASHFLMQELLLPACLELKKGNEQLTFEFCSLDTGVAMSKIEAAILDIALVFRSSYWKAVKERRLYSGHFNIVVRNDHPILRSRKAQLIEKLNHLPAITFRTASGGNFWESHPAFGKLGIIPKHIYFYDDTQTASYLLKNTDGWAFLPDVITKHFVKNSNAQSISKIFSDEDLNAPVDISLVYGSTLKKSLFPDMLAALLEDRIKRYSFGLV